MILKRAYADELRKKLASFPIVIILGPRQCGKTTFIKDALPSWTYQDLERPSHRSPLFADPESRVQTLGDHIVFDESQQAPELFPVLRSIIDEAPSRNGRYVLLGSASPTLIRNISETLAGRCAFVDMTGFSWKEMREHGSLNDLWFRGGYPSPFLMKSQESRAAWFEGYERTFIERDLTLLGLGIMPATLRRLLLMSAHVNSQLWNASSIANSLGVNYQTVNRYTDILEGAFLVRRLLPFSVNIGKRLVKRPRFMFRDSGLLHYLLGIATKTDLTTHPGRGESWESFMTEQALTAFRFAVSRFEPYFWRTAGGAEVDLLLVIGARFIPIKFKLHSSPSEKMTRGLLECMKDLSIKKGFLCYPGSERYSLGHGIEAIPATELLGAPEKIIAAIS
jgi:uncharacterized protein